MMDETAAITTLSTRDREQPDSDKTETVHCSSGKLVPTLISPDLDSNIAVKISLVCPISSD